MKKLSFLLLILALMSLNNAAGQWSYNGTHIYNSNTGNVGIGSSSPGKLLDVSKNMTEPTIRINNSGGSGGATFQMTDQTSGADWKFKATTTGGFKIRDNAYSLDVLTIEPNSAINALYINSAGNVGIRTATPDACLHVEENSPGFTGLFGTDDICSWNTSTNVNIGDANGPAVLYIGQDYFHKGFIYWEYNSDPTAGILRIGTIYQTNNISICHNGGKVGIHTSSPSALLEVYLDEKSVSRLGYNDTRPNYFYHQELVANGDGQAGIYTYRTRDSQNDGTDYDEDQSNAAITGANAYGDIYTYGVSGFNFNDYTRCGGILGAQWNGGYWGSLAYKNSAGTAYGGYFTSYSSGAGKSKQIVYTGIGVGAWGDLMAGDFHGRVYGIFAEGEDYALFSNGAVYRNDLDVHLQGNPDGTNSVMYTNVSTAVTIMTSGTAILNSGIANIIFDPIFASVVSADEPVVVTVTPVGNSNGVFLSAVTSSGFTVVENNDGKSNVAVNYIAIGRRAGYENPVLPPEVIDAGYTTKLARGLHADTDTHTDGEGLYYENGHLIVGIHPSTLPDPARPAEKMVITPADHTGCENTPAEMASRDLE